MTAIATLPVLLQTGIHSARPAASAVGSGALYNCTTHGLVYQQLAGSWGTWLTLPSTGLSDPMTTRGDIIVRNASNVTARLGIGSSGKVLSSDGTDISWQTPSGGSGVTESEAFLSGNVTITSNTYADGPSLSLAAGTYLLDTQLSIVATGAGWTTVKLMSGTTPLTATESYNNFGGAMLTYHLSGYTVLGSTTTVKVQATTDTGGTINTTPAHNATGLTNLNAYLRAAKIA